MNSENQVLISFLKSLGIKELNKNEKKVLAELILERKNLEVVKRELELLHLLNRVLLESYSKVSFSNMMKIYNQLDDQLLVDLYMAYFKIKMNAKNENSVFSFRKACEKILMNNKKVNFTINQMVADEVSKIDSIRNVLYFGMYDTDKADQLFLNCRKRSKHFLNNCDVENLSTLIECLKKNYKLDDDELVEISSKCATFFAFSSAEKLRILDKITSEFKEYILNSFKIDGKNTNLSNLMGRDFRDIIINSSSFLTSNIDSINDTIRFLKGDSLKDINGTIDVKGDFTSRQLAKIYNESITSLNISVDKISNVCNGVSAVYKRTYGEELDLNGFINGKNFSSISQLRNEDFDEFGKINEIFSILKMFVSPKEMKKLLENNMSFLIASPLEVKNSLKNAVLDSKNSDELKFNVLAKIRNHFDRNDSYDYSLNVIKGPSNINKLNKVAINDLDEQKVIDVLYKLEGSTDEINNWKKKWKDEEKELRDLELELEFESIIESLDTLESISDMNYSGIDDFIEEIMIVKSLMEEINNQYQDLIVNNKITKKFKPLEKDIQDRLANVIDIIDTNISKAISIYKESLSDLNLQLNVVNNDKSLYERINRQLISLQEEILNGKINEENLALQKEEIDKISKVITSNETRYKDAKKLEDICGYKATDFYDVLRKKDIKDYSDFNKKMSFYDEPAYMYELFLRILIREDLIYDDNLFADGGKVHSVSDREMKYEKYRLLLTDKQRDMADEIYKGFTLSCEYKIQTFDELCSTLEKHGINVDKITTIKKALGALRKLLSTYEQKYSSDINLLRKKANCENNLSKIDIDLVESKIKKLEEEIKCYSKKIDDLEMNRIKK